MKATTLKRLFSAVENGAEGDVLVVCRHIVDEERKLGHSLLAQDLQKRLDTAEKRTSSSWRRPATGTLSALPSNNRHSSPLLKVIRTENLRHHMVLSGSVDQRFQRIEKEFAARTRLAKYGLSPRNRILLYGPPGCGKSLGAERIAWSTGLPLHRVRFDTLISSFFGETASNLTKIFEAAEIQPCALFLDECDTIAGSRGRKNDVGEVSRIVNMLLQLLEDYNGKGIVIAATNYYQSLDQALYRRFDESIEIPLPGPDEIARLLESTLSSLGVERDVDYQAFANCLNGLSCNVVESIAKNAAKSCVMAGQLRVRLRDLNEASDEVRRAS